MKIGIASDHGGLNLKKSLIDELSTLGYEVTDFGPNEPASVDYPDYSIKVTDAILSGEIDRGILVCGTGIGMSIAANKVKGIRCALTHDVFSAQATRAHNDTNVIALGERVIGPGLALLVVKTWLETEFEGGRHATRIGKITELENCY
ncbi:MAG: ribose 5-phosphate isomerase B [Culicoidibacterales bacterium]